MGKKLTIGEVEKFVKKNSECELLSTEYTNNSTKMKFRCRCGNEFETTFNDFKQQNKRQCNQCSNKKRAKKLNYTTEEFKKEVYTLVENEYSVLGEYTKSRNKILMKHDECGHEWYVAPYSFKAGTRCPKCFGNSKKNTEQFKQKIKEKHGKEYTVLDEYINSQTPTLVKHNTCGYEWYATPNNLLQGHNCPKCAGNIKKTQKQFGKEVYALEGNEYIFLENYINNNTLITVRHNKCGNEYKTTPSDFLRGRRCPKCNESKGEKRISVCLDKNNINYISEYKIDKCKNIRPLPFDFAIFDNKNNLKYLIEYDGELHYKKGRWNEGKSKLLQIKKTEKIKNEYCKKHNIKLIRIPYWEFDNIEKILNTLI
ncbi:hypothetical protein [Hathewaya massiliensis]|uniref:hypothetical protein n=1 Tax=Hathewaya massiliensis TaxID=1964382 RepID=UPI00115AF092|nr:hypothetical protein [Hathewaya massiliensis]